MNQTPALPPGATHVGLASNDESGRVFCHLCGWTAGPFHSFELIEAKVADHLRDTHGIEMHHAVETETGQVKLTPRSPEQGSSNEVPP